MGVESAPRTQPTVAAHLDASHRVFPPLKLKRCSAQILLWQAHPSVLHSGHVLREEEAWGDRTFSRSLMARCVVGKGPRVAPQERRREHDGTVRVLYSARIADCLCCP